MRAVPLGLVLTIVAGVSASQLACQRHSPAQETSVLEPYVPSANAVGFDIFPLGGSDSSQNWLAAYTDEGRSAKFRIELSSATTAGNVSSGQGKLLPETDSDPLPFLQSLKSALHAQHIPTKIEKTDALPFDYVILGQNQTRSSDDSFRGTPKGNWTAMKISLGKGEVYLNLNPAAHKAEFAIKDPAYGDVVLAELAKVL